MERELPVGQKFEGICITPTYYIVEEGGRWRKWPDNFGTISLEQLHRGKGSTRGIPKFTLDGSIVTIFAICVGEYLSQCDKLIWDCIVGFRNELR